MARRQEDRAWGSPTRLSRASLRRPIVSPVRKAALTANFAHDDAPAQSLEPQQFPATPLRRARAFATIIR
jgi:hypothetical protein